MITPAETTSNATPPMHKTSVRNLSSWYTFSQISAEQKVTSISAGRSGAASHVCPPKRGRACCFSICTMSMLCITTRSQLPWRRGSCPVCLCCPRVTFCHVSSPALSMETLTTWRCSRCIFVNLEVVRQLHCAPNWVMLSLQTISYQILVSLSTLNARGARDGGETVTFLWLKPRHCINRTFGLVNENSARD